MKPFHKDPMLTANYAPVLSENDAPDLVVTEGEIPEGLTGTLYRNGSNPMFPSDNERYHWFAGEGMVHAVHVEDGKASYRNRFVRTPRYVAQRKAGRRLFPLTMDEQNEPVAGVGLVDSMANTHVIWHGNKLLALQESNLPFELTPDTLETLGAWDFDGDYKGPMTAHPRFDPKTGEMLTFGHNVAGPGSTRISYSTIDKAGKVTRQDQFDGPYSTILHDFLTTDEHVIFPFFPLTIAPERAMSGGPLIAWDPEQGTRIGIMRRDASVDTIRWFTGDPCYVYHHVNAYTVHENGRTKVIAETMKFARVPLFPSLDGSTGSHFVDGAQLVRWTFDMDGASDTYTEEVLNDLPGEFPRMDDRVMGSRHRHAFYAAHHGIIAEGDSFNAIVHADMVSGTRREYVPGPGRFVMEPVFVERSAEAPEGDGWLLTIVYDTERNLSDFVILDTDDVSAGPVARVELPTRVPYGFHGGWRGQK